MPTTKTKPAKATRIANTLTWEEFAKLEENATLPVRHFGPVRRFGPALPPVMKLYAFGQDTKAEVAATVRKIRNLGFDVFFEKNPQQPSYSTRDFIQAITPNADWRKLMCVVGNLKPDEVEEINTNAVSLWWD